MSATYSRRSYGSFTGITCDGATSMIVSDPTKCFETCSNVTIARVSITAHQTASVCGRLQDHGVIALGIHPLSGIEVVVKQFLIVTLRRTSQGVSRKHLSTVCVKSISGKNFPDSTTNYIGMMPYWDVSAVTNMNGAFENQVSFNADISSWDVSSVDDHGNDVQSEHRILLKNFLVGASVLPRAQPTCSLVRQHFRQRTRARAQTTGLELVQLTTRLIPCDDACGGWCLSEMPLFVL